jgi:hypothetical protein
MKSVEVKIITNIKNSIVLHEVKEVVKETQPEYKSRQSLNSLIMDATSSDYTAPAWTS